MKTAQRAWRCLARNPGKTLLLALVLFAASTLYLGTTVILDAAAQAQETLAAKTQAKIICEATDAAQPLAATDVDRVAACAGVARVNRQLQATVTLETGTPVTQSDSTTRANSQLSLIGLDDLAGDGPFADGSYHLQKGRSDVGKDGVIINAVLAAQNDWQIGDAITVEAAGKTLQLSICGIFSAGNEEKQSANTLALGRIENQLYASAEQVATLGDAATLVRLYAVSDAPWRLDALADELQQLFGKRAEITTAAAHTSARDGDPAQSGRAEKDALCAGAAGGGDGFCSVCLYSAGCRLDGGADVARVAGAAIRQCAQPAAAFRHDR